MKRILLISLMAILCITGNSLYAKDDTTKVAVDSASKVVNDVAQPVTLYARDWTNDVIEINGKKYYLESLPSQEKAWNEEEWVTILLLIVSIAALLLAAYSLFVVRPCLHKEEVDVRIDKALRDFNANVVSRIRPQSTVSSKVEIQKIQERISELEHRLKEIENNAKKPVCVTPVPQPKAPQEASAKPQPVPARQRYAYQNASNPNQLIGVSRQLDQYLHTFVITLDPGSEKEGSFMIIDKESIIANCLNNTDSMLCCDKEGRGTSIVKQIPGRVTINGEVAEVKQRAKVIVR